METFGENGESIVAKGPGGETAGLWSIHTSLDNSSERGADNMHLAGLLATGSLFYSSFGELTDKGRETTLQLGQRLRHLYVHQLGFLPKKQGDQSEYYLRYTPSTV
jgi:acid phosphatase